MEKNKMELDIKKLQRKELRSVPISVRTFPSYSKWMKKNEVSPGKLFNEAISQLMKESK